MKGFRFDVCLYAFLIGLIFFIILFSFSFNVSATEIPEEPTETVEEVTEETEPIEDTEEILPEDPVSTPELFIDETEEPETEIPDDFVTEVVVDDIPDDTYQAYVLGCLFFFVVVILFYFAYKFLKMFF